LKLFWPQPQCPTFFLAVAGQEEVTSPGTTYLNMAEASAIEKLVTELLRLGLKPEQVGVITPYEGQRAYIMQYVAHAKLSLDVEVASVNAFQVLLTSKSAQIFKPFRASCRGAKRMS